jgi:hypothetical protein
MLSINVANHICLAHHLLGHAPHFEFWIYWVKLHAMMWRAMPAGPCPQGTNNVELRDFFNEAMVGPRRLTLSNPR